MKYTSIHLDLVCVKTGLYLVMYTHYVRYTPYIKPVFLNRYPRYQKL